MRNNTYRLDERRNEMYLHAIHTLLLKFGDNLLSHESFTRAMNDIYRAIRLATTFVPGEFDAS